jgi:hypothetical protein
MAHRSTLLLVAGLVLVGCAGAALLQRPEQDCINPSMNKINEFNFFPEDYRSLISPEKHISPSAVVSSPPCAPDPGDM